MPSKSREKEFQSKQGQMIGEIQLGKEGKRFTVLFDSGSSNIILPSTDCQQTVCLTRNRYSPKESSASTEIDSLALDLKEYTPIPLFKGKQAIEIDFTTGRIQATKATDTVCLGTFCSKMTILSAFFYSEEPFNKVQFDGIFGLSPSSQLSTRFTIALENQGKAGEIQFNAPSNPNTLFVPLIASSYWEIELKDIILDQIPTNYCQNRKCSVIIDSGSSVNLVDTALFTLLQRSCKSRISLQLAETELPLSQAVLSLSSSLLKCKLLCMEIDSLSSTKHATVVLGMPFLRQYSVTFDKENRRIGFLPLNQTN